MVWMLWMMWMMWMMWLVVFGRTNTYDHIVTNI